MTHHNDDTDRAATHQDAKLDRLLASLTREPAPPGLERRILDAIAADRATRPAGSSQKGIGQAFTDWFTGALWRPAVAAVLPLMLGFAIGLAAPAENADSAVDLTEQLALLAFNAPEEAFDDAQ